MLGKGHVARAADDKMIQNPNVHEGKGFFDLLRYVLIGLAGFTNA